MKTLKLIALIVITFTFIKCDDNSSSDPGGSTANPQYAYITDGSLLKIIEIDPLNPNTIVYTSDISLNTSYFVSVSPDVAYVAQYDAVEPYLSLVNISTPSTLSATAIAKNSTNNFSLLSDMFTINGTGFITDFYRGLNTIDTANFPGLTTSNTGSDAMSLTKIGNNLYIIDQVNGLSIYDVSTPNNPTYTGVRNNTDVDTSSYPNTNYQFHSWVETDGTFIYVANIFDKKLKKFDATTLNLISEVAFEGYTTAFAISNGQAYITSKAGASPLQTSFDGISMFDLSTMTFTNHINLNEASGVAVNGNYAYVTDADALHIYDISSGSLVLQTSSGLGKGNFIALGE